MRRSTIFGAALVLLAFTLMPGSTSAAETITVDATLSDRAVPLGEIVTMEVTIVARTSGAIDVSIPEVDGLTELSRSRSESTSMSWTGAGQQIRLEYTITIEYQTDKAGRITIPPIVAKLGSAEARSAATTLNVMTSKLLAQAAKAMGPGQITPPAPHEAKLFVRYRSDRSEAFLGQQILLDLEILALPRVNFSIEQGAAPPALDGFWQETIEKKERIHKRIERVGGRQYHVYRVWRLALFPLQAGERTIPPAAMTFGINRTIFGVGKRVRRSTPPVKLDVKPLPTEGRPPGFSNNNVGSYALSATVDHRKVPAGKAVLFKLSLDGRGNIKNARLPTVESVDGFRVFQPTLSDDVKKTMDGVRGQKRAEILLMPVEGGRLEIPSFALTVFEPESSQYRRLTTETIRIVVEGDPSAHVSQPELQGPDGPEKPRGVAKKDLRPLRFRSKLTNRSTAPYESPKVAALFFAPPLLFILFILGELGYARTRRETPASRRRRSARLARQRLQKAREAALGGELALGYSELNEALLELGSEKCSVGLRGLTTEEVAKAFVQKGATEELALRIAKEMETANFARFAPGGVESQSDAKDALDRWQTLLADLESFTPREDS